MASRRDLVRRTRTRIAGAAMCAAAVSAAGPSPQPPPTAPQPNSYASPPFTPIPSRPPPPVQEIRRPQFVNVQQLDAAIDELRRTSWQLASMYGSLKDSRGRTATQDVDEWLLTPAHETELSNLRATAADKAAKGDKKEALAALNLATGAVQHETYMAGVLNFYWNMCGLAAVHFANLQTIVARISPPQHVQDAAVNMIAARVAKDLQQAMAAAPAEQINDMERLKKGRHDLLQALNEARGRYATQLSQQQRAQTPEELTYPSDTPCAPAVPRTSGKEHPAFAADNASPESFYPDSSRRAEYEGSVTVKAWVSAHGCAEKVAVYTSSGIAELDQAAIRWAQQAHFQPAERDHEAVDDTLTFVVKFVLGPEQ